MYNTAVDMLFPCCSLEQPVPPSPPEGTALGHCPSVTLCREPPSLCQQRAVQLFTGISGAITGNICGRQSRRVRRNIHRSTEHRGRPECEGGTGRLHSMGKTMESGGDAKWAGKENMKLQNTDSAKANWRPEE